MILNVNAIYPTFQGEVNVKGIGAPVIFVRLQGCHLRCYKDTLGVLCDTPEALEGKEVIHNMSIFDITQKVNTIREETGISLICLSGGDPLWRTPDTVLALLTALVNNHFDVSIETSGTLSIKPYARIEGVHFVLDYKTKSAGVKQKFIINEIDLLKSTDFIKFVLYDTADYEEFKEVLPLLKTKAQIGVGVYWGGKLGTMQLFSLLTKDGLLNKVQLNVQLHKMATFCDLHQDLIEQTSIPTKI